MRCGTGLAAWPCIAFLWLLITALCTSAQRHSQAIVAQTATHDKNIRKDGSGSRKNVPVVHNTAGLAKFVPAVPRTSSFLSGGRAAGASVLSGGHRQRSINDWEVEDFVLLATVDGTLYARDRKTGTRRWEIYATEPVVQTIDHRANNSDPEQKGKKPLDDNIWIVEPVQNGALFLYTPDIGLTKLGVSIKDLVDHLSPFAPPGSDRVYNGDKKTQTFAIDASTGKVQRVFSAGSLGNIMNNKKCKPNRGLEELDEECESPERSEKTILVGRTEYTIIIESISTGERLWTIKYSEWGPNNSDKDLAAQHRQPMDNRYIYSGHDGKIFGFDDLNTDPMDERRPKYQQTFSSPVIRVFDVVKSSTEPDTETFLVLPQPNVPSNDVARQEDLTFVGCTKDGGWYAMSEASYPHVTNRAPDATCYNRRLNLPKASHSERTKALVGIHRARSEYEDSTYRTLPAPQEYNDSERPKTSSLPSPPSLSNERVKHFATDLMIMFPFICIGIYFVTSHKRGFRWWKPTDEKDTDSSEYETRLQRLERNIFMGTESNSSAPGQQSESLKTREMVVRFEDPPKEGQDREGSKSDPLKHDAKAELDEAPPAPTPKKKKAHRGTRGGARKRAKSATGAEKDQEKIDKIVEHAKDIEHEVPLEPDVRISSIEKADEVDSSSHVISINNLNIYDNQIIGRGSQGTVVYKGSFEGKEVAVKRVLAEFINVASHEVQLLQQSDDHPNVIRYYCQQRKDNNIYMALELCPASLFDVISNQAAYPALHGMLDQVDVLHQIASGVHHLHSLKIVHRDLKPQNILVSEPKPLPKDPKVKAPRILISDFGLCKLLQDNQSSFGPTSTHAAGTVGWRAPELLVDEEYIRTPQAESTGSTSDTTIIDTLTNRRATRAIDIFSLGCVFFWVLSNGQHPFGNKFHRELNIVHGKYDLSYLDIWGDRGYEAKKLIASMIHHNPRKRPDATKVLSHPFFWSPEKRLNFLLDVSDRFEVEKDKEKDQDYKSPHIPFLEDNAKTVVGINWLKKLDRGFLDELLGNKRRGYDGEKVLDLLRAIRNKKHHYQDMKPAAKHSVGPLPQGYLSYFMNRFPDLLIHAFQVIREAGFSEEPEFRPYYSTS